MSDPSPSLREHLEQRLQYERTLTDQRFTLLQHALEIQAKEYERRLTELNHAHARAVAEQERVLPREMFDQFMKEHEAFRRATETQLNTMNTRAITWTAGVTLFLLIASLAIRLWPVVGP